MDLVTVCLAIVPDESVNKLNIVSPLMSLRLRLTLTTALPAESVIAGV